MAELQPAMEHTVRMRLSNIIYRKSLHTGIPARLVLAIAMQESSLTNAVRTDRTGITDIGYFQIHVGTAAYYRIDVGRLFHDLEYQVDSHYKILQDKIRVCRNLGVKPAWPCYHSFTPRLRKTYQLLVERYLYAID